MSVMSWDMRKEEGRSKEVAMEAGFHRELPLTTRLAQVKQLAAGQVDCLCSASR